MERAASTLGLRGPIANVFTAFHEDGSLDLSGERHLFDYLLSTESISAYFVRSGMGQMYTFDYEDVLAIARTALDHFRGVAPVFVGTSGIWNRDFDQRPEPETYIRQSIELSLSVEELGAAATVHVLPEALSPEGGTSYHDVILRYFERIDEAVSTPIIIYQPPPTLPEYQVDEALMARLAALANVQAIKLSTQSAGFLFDIAQVNTKKGVTTIAGDERAFYASLYAGGKGVIGQGCCLNPNILAALEDRFERGDHAGALEAQRSANLLCRCSPPDAVAFLKRYATEKGYPVGPHFRPAPGHPYLHDPEPMTEEQYSGFVKVLENEVARYPSGGVARPVE